MAAVDRANLTPYPVTADPADGRTIRVIVARANLTPSSQASTGTPVALTSTPFNPGLQT